MSFSVGIIGLPNVGKSTLFKTLTKKQVDIADYPFTTINPNIGVVAVPDKRLEKISEIVKPEKTTQTVIKFVDIAGLVKDAHKGKGMGNQFLSHIRPCDALVEVVKSFGDSNPEQDMEIIKNELLMKDQELRDNVLTSKPIIHLFNTDKADRDPVSADQQRPGLWINLKQETNLDQLILACYNILELITFFTITGGKETKAWTLKRGSNALEAAEKVHTDFAEKFIKAKLTPWQELIKSGSWKIVGKDYIVQDGDIIEFRT